jgi:hypothetical protein
MATEGAVSVYSIGTEPVRIVKVTTLVNGVPTTVDMQVLAIADEQGNIINRFADYSLQQQMVNELRALRLSLEQWLGKTEASF